MIQGQGSLSGESILLKTGGHSDVVFGLFLVANIKMFC